MQIADEGQKFIGTKCNVCTGCGRCVGLPDGNGISRSGAVSGMHVVTQQNLQEGTAPISADGGVRLVTADIGTTTIAMQLYLPDGTVEAEYAKVNPQTVYGPDVLSRVEAARDESAAQRMQQMVQDILQDGLTYFQGYLKEEERMRMVLAGNTTMIYLLCGYDPAELGHAPFHATHLLAEDREIAGVPCYIFPGLSAFVGGDITAGIYACGVAEQGELTLFIDLGTNGEMVLGNKDRRIACATAAGPAFEGGVNRGIWGADMVHLLAVLRRKGIVDETGLLADHYFEEGVRIGDVCVTQASIRAIQLAKAAIRAGIDILMLEYGIAGRWEQIDRVVLAGGFGYYLDPLEAGEIGLIPREFASKAVAGGNTALGGALRYGRELLETADPEGKQDDRGGRSDESKLQSLIAGTKILNLAEHPGFEELYLQYMNFPTDKNVFMCT